jgi:predicted nucleic acid-binding protein
MGFLIDTNVLSELRKGARCDPRVAAWVEPIPDEELFLSVISLAEIRRGVELAWQRRDHEQAVRLERWMHSLYSQFGDRIVSIAPSTWTMSAMAALRRFTKIRWSFPSAPT